MEEVKKVPGYPFFVSSMGTVYNQVGRPYKLHISNKGYWGFTTRINGKCIRFLAHRLVAMAFLENPNDYPCVNHKDENPLNNNVDNLEWCTHKYNSNYGTAISRTREKQLNDPAKSKQVLRINGNEIVKYPSAKQAERELHINNANIIACCLGKRKSAGGFRWGYAT